eukprot:8002-Rhodomonas_salina.1
MQVVYLSLMLQQAGVSRGQDGNVGLGDGNPCAQQGILCGGDVSDLSLDGVGVEFCIGPFQSLAQLAPSLSGVKVRDRVVGALYAYPFLESSKGVRE